MEIDAVYPHVYPMIGRQACKPVRTHGSMFILDIGNLYLHPKDERPHGEWSLMVEQAQWVIMRYSEPLVSSRSKPSDIDRSFSKFTAERVRDVTIEKIDVGLRINFDKGFELKIQQSYQQYSMHEDQWSLFCPNKIVISARDCTLSREA